MRLKGKKGGGEENEIKEKSAIEAVCEGCERR